MNNKSFLVSIAMIIMAGCVSEDDALLKTRVPISLTTSIAPTRATQDVQIGDGQEVYIWANEEEVSGTTNWDANNYIEAWHLTANATGGLTSANTYYYPTRPLSMVAIHGNFEFDEGKTQFPGVVSHTILADQSTAANLMKSDLLWWKGTGITSAGNPGGIPVTFAHNLSKIEITLSSDFYTTDQLNAMEVSLCNVLPTVDLSLADGTTNAAHGTRITVTPLKPSASSPTFEAVIPAQARPDNFIVVRLDGGVVNVDAQVSEFDANTRYPYNLDITYRDVRKNPLWYVAEYNVNYDGSSTYSWATTPDEGYYFSWSDAMKAFTTAANASAASPTSISNYYLGTGCKFAGWHLPSQAEWWSISPGGDLTNIWTFDSEGTGTYKASNQTVVFGYNSETQEGIPEASYWKKISSNELHALRFIGSDYCSAWKYVWDVNNGMTVYATLVDKIENTSEAVSSWYTNRWNSVYFGNNHSIGAVSRTFGKSGFSGTGSGTTGGSLPNSVYHWTTTSQNANDAYVLVFAAGFSYVDSANDRKAYGRRIRLFRDGYNKLILPMDYVATTNMYNSTTFASNNKMNTSCFMTWATAYGYYNTTNGTQRTLTGRTCTGGTYYRWHLPTFPEASAIVPAPNTSTKTSFVRFDQTNLLNSGLSEALEWGWNGSSYNVSKTFYAEYKNISTNHSYAVRYKDSDTPKGGYGIYTTAFRYEFNLNYPESGDEVLIIRWKYLGPNSTDILSNGSDDVIGNEAYWTTYDGEIVLPRAGYTGGNASAGGSTGINGHYWTSSSYNDDQKYLYYFNQNYVGENNSTTRSKNSGGETIRLYADAE